MPKQIVDRDAPPRVANPPTNTAWLAKLAEDVVDPDRPIVDPHHHFLDHADNPYRLDDLLADLDGGHNVEATVYLQCFRAYRTTGPDSLAPVGETESVARMAAEADRRETRARICAGIVGYADLTLGDEVAPVLAAHSAAGGGRFRGVRHITARHPSFIASLSTPPAFGVMGTPAFRAGFARLSEYGLTFDAWLYFTQIDQLIDLARAFPGTPIVLNHTAGPLGIGAFRGRRDETFPQWRKAITALSGCPNVHMKLGGLGMAVNGFDFHKQVLPPSSGELKRSWEPYILTSIETFGVDRCMFESNFPVDKSMCSYAVLWNSFKRIVSGATEDEKSALFHNTAMRFYRL